MVPFLKHPQPFDDESLSGYLFRLAILNFCSLKMIYSELKLNHRVSNYYIDTANISDADFKWLSEKTKCQYDVLSNLRFITIDNSNIFYLYNNKINISNISSTKAKVCPLCLLKHEYIRKIWSLVNVTACPFHQIELIDKCENCNENISWIKCNIFRCGCGHNHKNSIVIKAKAESLYNVKS